MRLACNIRRPAEYATSVREILQPKGVSGKGAGNSTRGRVHLPEELVMGQKVNPIGFRLGVNRDWRARWYASPQELPAFLHSDLEIRNYVKKKLQFAAVSKIVIERAWNSIRVTIHTARPGIVIGRKGAEIEKMTEEISKMAQGKQIKIDIQEIKAPELDAQLVAENVALQTERRIAYRRAMKKAVQVAMDFGAEGI